MKCLKKIIFLFSLLLFTPAFCQDEDLKELPKLPEIKEPTEFETEGVEVEVPEGPPKPPDLDLPEPKDKTGDLFEQFGIPRRPRKDEAFLGLVSELQKQLEPLYFSDIPLVQDIPMPEKIREFFENIVMYVPDIKIDGKGGFSITGQIDVYDVAVWSRVSVAKDKTGAIQYSIVIRLPNSWKFSDTFPKTKYFNPEKFDLLEFGEIWFALSSVRYTDPVLEREVREGLNLFGSVKPVGPLFEKLDTLFGGRLTDAKLLSMQGAIGLNKQLIGTLLAIDLPTGVMFTKWLETSPLTMIFAIEDRITQTATPVIAFRGGLNVLLPLQKEPIDLNLVGKYIFPEDLEFYAEMDGWIRNVPVPGFHFGDQKFGIVVDLALAALSEGAFTISGINIGGAAGIMDSYYSLQVKGALSADTAIGDLTFIFDGTARLKDLIGFWFKNAENIARVFKKNTRFYEKVMDKIPNLELEEVRFAFVPRETIEEKKRIEVNVGKLNLFGLWGNGRFFFSSNRVSGAIHLPEVVIGPKEKPLLKISGSGVGDHKGIALDFEASPYNQSAFADVEVETSLFGGIERRGRFDLHPGGFEVASQFRWADVIDTNFQIKALLFENGSLSPENILTQISFEQRALDKLSSILTQAAEDLLEEVQEEIDRIYTESLKGIRKRIGTRRERLREKIDAKLDQIKQKRSDCREKHPQKIAAGLRRACEFLKGVPLDVMEIAVLATHKDVTLQVERIGGELFIKSAFFAAKGVTIPLGKFAKFLAQLIENTFKIDVLRAQASLERLKEGKPFVIEEFKATLLGRDFELFDVEFDMKKPRDFVLRLFEETTGEQLVPVE